ncbi:helix-turn-helix domain-containing protein [Streptomyces cinnabarinus]|uniref:Helix-turn-helix domain-containing protein n=1 Tax=Streptomyces cinnabarinus TaxID=67287 RepID=A0ABY7KQV3_9ACTN|nr:hypothetical protein [Streptomyces cinnabarinus]WAZ26941.1 helix-turn-helix domain-containing protein [Streptomyces cinnabarinus]
MSRFGEGVRRGVMAADQFTQIANGLFRDSRLSYKAKGIFGYVSTHRNGWQVTVDDLVRLGPDGREAVRTGLQELEARGYLIRERLRRPDGTLGEIVYCITDRPALLGIALNEPDLVATALEAERACGLPAGIRRGVMAADQFTQIANGLFRGTRLSFKAKGLFGLLSTHRDGWRMTVADIARRGCDGDSSVKSGLKELEKHGFLVRERDRGPDGTLGSAAYLITDLPALQNPSSQPESGFPPVDDPTLADPGTKNTIVKKTNKQNTRPLRPCGEAPPARGRTDRPRTPRFLSSVPAADDVHPGIRLLLGLGAARPELLLTGQALTDQGRVVRVMLESGWSAEQLRYVIAARPLPNPVRTTVGAIVAARLRAAQAYPPPARAAGDHGQLVGEGPPPQPVTGSAAARTVSEALTYRAFTECAGCGGPATARGEDLCPACLGWPLCNTCPGPTPRRAHPGSDGRCTRCASALTDHHVEGRTPRDGQTPHTATTDRGRAPRAPLPA